MKDASYSLKGYAIKELNSKKYLTKIRNDSDVIHQKDDIRQVVIPEDLVINDPDTCIWNCKVIGVHVVNQSIE